MQIKSSFHYYDYQYHHHQESFVKADCQTRKNAILDLIVTNISDCCNSLLVILPIELSDHMIQCCALLKNKTKNDNTSTHVAKLAFEKWL